jgi:hypothetical protein
LLRHAAAFLQQLLLTHNGMVLKRVQMPMLGCPDITSRQSAASAKKLSRPYGGMSSLHQGGGNRKAQAGQQTAALATAQDQQL